jgi:hypothetical protein
MNLFSKNGILRPVLNYLVGTSADFKHYSYMKKPKILYESNSGAKMQ